MAGGGARLSCLMKQTKSYLMSMALWAGMAALGLWAQSCGVPVRREGSAGAAKSAAKTAAAKAEKEAQEAQEAVREAQFKAEIRPLLDQYCFKCHGAEEMKSGVRVDLLDGAFRGEHVVLWQHIAEQLEEEFMPPEDKPQPTAAQRAKLVKWIREGVRSAQMKSRERNGWARRMTVPQYRNTLQDLLGLEDDLTGLLPSDGLSKDGFTNNGDSLQLSPLQMEYYLQIADQALDLCLIDPDQPPAIQNFRMELGENVNATPAPDNLVLGAGSALLSNKTFKVTELTPDKPFAQTPFRMKQAYDFIEGYAGNATVRGLRHFTGLEHAVYACMRGTHGYPLGLAHSFSNDALLLRPAIPSSEVFGQGSTMGPMANFKISLRELPKQGRFRITVKASRVAQEGFLLPAGKRLAVDENTLSAEVENGPATLRIPADGVYQVDMRGQVKGNGGPLTLLLNGQPHILQIKGGQSATANHQIDINDLPVFTFDAMRVTVPGKERVINLHEVRLMANGKNIAPAAEITSSSDYSADGRFGFGNLVDGNLSNLAHSAEEDNPWFQLAFKEPQTVEEIHVWNRKGFEDRFRGAEAVFTLKGKEVYRRAMVSSDRFRHDALMRVRLAAGDLRVEASPSKQVEPAEILFHPLPADSEEALAYDTFAARAPQLGVHLGFRRDCGSTLPLVGEPQAVTSGAPKDHVFTGAINNYPSPSVDAGNQNYLAGIREIGVRSEYTDGRDMPRLRVHSVEFEGPYHAQWPPASYRRIFIDSPDKKNPPAYARDILKNFMARAYRRAPTDEEVALVHGVWAAGFKAKGDFRASLKDALTVVLTSPQFMFVIENSAGPEPEDLTPHELASKLSYFLWDTMPDAELGAKAQAGALHGSLDAQVDRMLDDPRARRFFATFATQWLTLDKFDTVEVDRKKFPKLTRDTKAELRKEPAAFLRHVVTRNLPVRNLVKSDFIMANDVVAAYYGLGDRSESGFAFVPLKHGSPDRGGLLTQTGILCGLSSGSESHPVKRGAWLARKIVAQPPGDPPPNVPELKEDHGEKLTLRQRLERHRNQPGCIKCHEKIDPWGIPMEEFSPDGMRKAGPLAGSTLPDGTEVAGFDALRDYLADPYLDQVAYGYMKHLAIYALGRSLSIFEQEELRKACLTLRKDGYKTRDMLHWLVKSDLFLKK